MLDWGLFLCVGGAEGSLGGGSESKKKEAVLGWRAAWYEK